MCPPSRKFVNGDGGLFERGLMVCHVLLVETESGLALVDTGFGTDDCARPEHLGGAFRVVTNARLDRAETALAQVEALGFERGDVRHLLVTHLDLDHAGGIPDFPEATVHIHAPEHAAAMSPRTLGEKNRYKPRHWAHGPRFRTYEAAGEPWFGFSCVRALDGLPPEILIVPLAGHTRGHAAIAVKSDRGWLVHAGDAYFYRGEIDADRPTCPAGLSMFQRLVATDDRMRRDNQRRLRELARDHAGEVRVFSAHDPVELDRERVRASA